MPDEGKVSTSEAIKSASNGLRGTISQELELPVSGFSRANAQLLKFHGVFQQEDRDVRLQRRMGGEEPEVEFTVRVRATGGWLTASQMLGLLELVEDFYLGPLRATSRQGLQLSQLRKCDLKKVIAGIARLGLTTFSSGGDVNCNVMCCPTAGDDGGARAALFRLARQIEVLLMPDAAGYRSLWLADDSPTKSTCSNEVHEQNGVYGPTFLPHKFKVGLALPEDNCVDVYAQDIGLLMSHREERVDGYEVLVGGGMSMIPSVSRNTPRLAQPLTFVAPGQVLEVIRAIVEVYREFGDRSRQTRARLKYLVADRGLEEFGQLVQSRLDWKLPSPRDIAVTGRDDHLGWQSQSDGSLLLGLPVESGRLQDRSEGRMASALRSILQRFDSDVRLTPQQNLLLSGVAANRREDIEAILAEHDIPPVSALTGVRRSAMSCPAMPSCRSAITEAERIVPELLAALEAELLKLGLADEPCTLCVTGCSHGCARCFLADIALVGRTIMVERDGDDSAESHHSRPAAEAEKRSQRDSLLASRVAVPTEPILRKVDKFAIYVGGDPLGRRLNRLYRDLVPLDQIIDVLRPLLVRFRQQRRCEETLGAFLWRVAAESD